MPVTLNHKGSKPGEPIMWEEKEEEEKEEVEKEDANPNHQTSRSQTVSTETNSNTTFRWPPNVECVYLLQSSLYKLSNEL